MDEERAKCHFALNPSNGEIITVKNLDPFNDVEALELSVAKWDTIIEALEADYEVQSDGGHATCGLCTRHFDGAGCSKNGICPVIAVGGCQNCVRTPYDTWREAKENGDTCDMLDAAVEERDFLSYILAIKRLIK